MASLQEIQFLTPYGIINVDVSQEGKDLDEGKFRRFLWEFVQCLFASGADEYMEEFLVHYPEESRVLLRACRKVKDDYGLVVLPDEFIERVLRWIEEEEEE